MPYHNNGGDCILEFLFYYGKALNKPLPTSVICGRFPHMYKIDLFFRSLEWALARRRQSEVGIFIGTTVKSKHMGSMRYFKAALIIYPCIPCA
jgi:hypothetical protein